MKILTKDFIKNNCELILTSGGQESIKKDSKYKIGQKVLFNKRKGIDVSLIPKDKLQSFQFWGLTEDLPGIETTIKDVHVNPDSRYGVKFKYIIDLPDIGWIDEDMLSCTE